MNQKSSKKLGDSQGNVALPLSLIPPGDGRRTAASLGRSEAPSSPHATQAWLAVVRAYNLCDVVLTTRLAEFGLRVGDHEVLANLARAPGITQQELAARCFVTKSGVSMLLAQMESRALVVREADAGDARVKRLFLTTTGLALAQCTLAIQAEIVGAMAEGSSDRELAALAALMQRVSTRLEALRDAPGKAAQRGRRAKLSTKG
jgi:DNA-binding MarR family transcriptional regulator